MATVATGRGGTTMSRPRALVRDMSAAAASTTPAPTLEIDPRPAYDFLVSLMCDEVVDGQAPEILPADAAWLRESRASLSAGVRRDLRRTFAHDEEGVGIGAAIVPLVVTDSSVRTSADVVALVGRLSATDLIPRLCVPYLCRGEHLERARELADAALAGDASARELLLSSIAEWARPELRGILDDPEEAIRAARRVLRAWHERFATVEARVARMEDRDAADRRREMRTLALGEFVEKTTGGVRVVPEPGLRRLILAPGYFGRPFNEIYGDRDWRLIVYPLGDAALDGDVGSLPTATVRLFKALGDESRLRILRYLADGDLYLTEIADRMNLSKPTVKHHMVQLRTAGLVTVAEVGGLTYYTLRRERLGDASADLQRLLGA